MQRVVLPLFLTICFYFESIFVQFVPHEIFKSGQVLAPRFLLVLFVLMGIFYFRNRSIIYAAVFGLIFDVYYAEIIGIYLVIFPVTVYLASKMAKVLQANIFSALIISAICISAVEMAVYAFHVFILLRQMDFMFFVDHRLWATLILNLLFTGIVYYPFTKFLMKRQKLELNE